MKKENILYSLLFFVILLLPSSVFAAFNDVTLTADAIISVDGYTLNVSGSSAVIESIEVGATSFGVTLASGSSITVSSPDLYEITTDPTTGVTNTCNGTTSSVAITGTGTYTVTPTATVCEDATPDPEPEPTPSSSGTRSGSRSRASTPVVVQSSIPSTSVGSPVSSASLFTKGLFVGVTDPEVKKLQELLASLGLFKGPFTGYFGPLTSEAVKAYQLSKGIDPVGFVGPATRASLNTEVLANNPSPTAPSTPSTNSATFTRNLDLNDVGPDVKVLQKYLNAKGFIIAVSGPGSVGNETERFGALTRSALVRFQNANGITPAVGFFGPVTRAFINTNP